MTPTTHKGRQLYAPAFTPGATTMGTEDPFLTPANDGEGDAVVTYCGEEMPARPFTPAELEAWCEHVRDCYEDGFRSGRYGRTYPHADHTFPNAYLLGVQHGAKMAHDAALAHVEHVRALGR